MNKLEMAMTVVLNNINNYQTDLWQPDCLKNALKQLKMAIDSTEKLLPLSPKIALYDFIPIFCPYCGARVVWLFEEFHHIYVNGQSNKCVCGVHHQYVRSKLLKKAVDKSGGDLNKALLKLSDKGRIKL